MIAAIHFRVPEYFLVLCIANGVCLGVQSHRSNHMPRGLNNIDVWLIEMTSIESH